MQSSVINLQDFNKPKAPVIERPEPKIDNRLRDDRADYEFEQLMREKQAEQNRTNQAKPQKKTENLTRTNPVSASRNNEQVEEKKIEDTSIKGASEVEQSEQSEQSQSSTDVDKANTDNKAKAPADKSVKAEPNDKPDTLDENADKHIDIEDGAKSVSKKKDLAEEIYQLLHQAKADKKDNTDSELVKKGGEEEKPTADVLKLKAAKKEQVEPDKQSDKEVKANKASGVIEKIDKTEQDKGEVRVNAQLEAKPTEGKALDKSTDNNEKTIVVDNKSAKASTDDETNEKSVKTKLDLTDKAKESRAEKNSDAETKAKKSEVTEQAVKTEAVNQTPKTLKSDSDTKLDEKSDNKLTEKTEKLDKAEQKETLVNEKIAAKEAKFAEVDSEQSTTRIEASVSSKFDAKADDKPVVNKKAETTDIKRDFSKTDTQNELADKAQVNSQIEQAQHQSKAELEKMAQGAEKSLANPMLEANQKKDKSINENLTADKDSKLAANKDSAKDSVVNQQFDTLVQDARGAEQLSAAVSERSNGQERVNSAVTLNQLNSSAAKVETMSQAEKAEQKQTLAQQLKEVAIPLNKPEAPIAIANAVRFMTNQRIQAAEIRLDPPELGSMQIKVSMNGEQASVSMIVQNPQAKEMLDQAIPKLKEMLEEAGIELGESNIEQQAQHQDEQSSGEGYNRANHANAGESLPEEDVIHTNENKIVNGHVGEVDYYA
ncbi:flagellar hook-length control protein FliK [Catenovulum sp. SM1970]|uniref:flagellar hook-length control protein FliK n=1 Tax=Marinifaba aquimaris TaxID=2741323 RepID=UPI001574A08F|nr:flagellar hook-length control protein FliK [Marinifaba aquimaris]NTS76390.1 flagellar hook-length control protein FliK [Marinifaba aquimaris]